jgi:hypothetical protein
VVLATTDAWPDLATCLSVLEPQVRALDAELIIGDGDGQGLPEQYAADPDRLVWIRQPGASVFELRALGVAKARGEIIATTEDHCVVRPDWCERILAAFARDPEVVAVAGAIENGSTTSAIDWANYLHTFGALAPPVDPAQRERCPVNANLAYRRELFPAGAIEPGWMEITLNGRLFQERRFHFDDRIGVSHVQSHGFIGTLLSHFHNGRATTGLGQVSLSRRQLPWRVFGSAMRAVRRKPALAPVARRHAPLIAMLSCCHAAGEVAGILFGPGRSPAQLR